MPDIQSLHSALGTLPQKERNEFLGAALSQQPVEFLESILQKLGLEELPVNAKVRLVFKMGLSPVAHAYKAGPDRQLQWVIPSVPDHLRPLVYSTSRLINEFLETLACLKNGKGDFVKAFTLLNPDNMLGMVNRFNDEMQTYTQQLREANGRFNRYGQQRGRHGNGLKPATPAASPQDAPQEQPASKIAMPEPEPELKTRKSNAKTRSKAQPQAAEKSGENPSGVESPAPALIHEPVPESVAIDASSYECEAAPAAVPDGDSASSLTGNELAAFGFDVLAAAAETPRADSGK
ncbi:MAG: hypothetical protein LBM00_05530 [Deltaproteobacteria bacterium]|jgi:hypothetical protein|nr:hypothetical protein [Deltaproteobacteria bacterium]